MKTCSTCKIKKSIDNFGKDKSRKDGLNHVCKSCRKEYDRLKYARDPKKQISATLKYKYGVSLQQKQNMIASQNGGCVICKTKLDNGKHTCVDHCHATGKVRQILCKHCNSLLGNCKENIETLKNAIQYLITHKQ
jgi:hypothetical protein